MTPKMQVHNVRLGVDGVNHNTCGIHVHLINSSLQTGHLVNVIKTCLCPRNAHNVEVTCAVQSLNPKIFALKSKVGEVFLVPFKGATQRPAYLLNHFKGTHSYVFVFHCHVLSINPYCHSAFVMPLPMVHMLCAFCFFARFAPLRQSSSHFKTRLGPSVRKPHRRRFGGRYSTLHPMFALMS